MSYDELKIQTVEQEISVWAFAPPTSITFENKSKLDWSTGKLVWSGEDMDESAIIFFNFLKPYIDQYIQTELLKDKNER